MAISRKGMRKIVVDNVLYYYKITHSSGKYSKGNYLQDHCWDDYYPHIKVVIEYPNGKILTHIEDWECYVPFTPKDVRRVIKINSERCAER
jgi:predicted N-acyltransferase